MTSSFRTRIATAAALGGAFALAVPAAAQISAPPRHDTRSPGGVSFRDGAFSWEESDLSIGGEEGLTLSRTYLSSSQDGQFSPGWTHNWYSIVRNEPEPVYPDTMPPPPHLRAWVYHLVVGGSTYSFVGGGSYPNQGQPVGSYQSVEDNGASLVYTGTNASGYYTLSLADGSVIVWSGGISSHITSWTRADGTRLDYSYGTTRMIASNRGYALIFEGATSKACVVNLSRTYVTAGSACPSGVPTVTYAYTTGAYTHGPLLPRSPSRTAARRPTPMSAPTISAASRRRARRRARSPTPTASARRTPRTARPITPGATATRS
jgi:hypothetical protein